MNGFHNRREKPAPPRIPPTLVPVRWIDTRPVRIFEKTCTISSLNLNAHISGLYADVEETIVISNQNKRDLSVDLAIPLPDRAIVRGYALDIDGQMIDGVVVPKEKARIAFETEQRRGIDPGLVEAVKGNVYRTRVYPVPAHGSRTVRLSYTTPLLVIDGQAAFFDAPMPTERLGERTMRIDVELPHCPAPELSGVNGAQFKELGMFWSVESRESDIAPQSSVRVALPQLPTSFSLVERDSAGDVWFSASESVPVDNIPDCIAGPTSLTILWDTSGSRAGIDHEAELSLLRNYCALDAITSYTLVAFSDRVDAPEQFESADELIERIRTLRYDGGSDFQALSRVASELHATDAESAFILFTDGMDTLSGEPLSFPRTCALLAVVSGAQRDTEALRQACGGLAFDVSAAPKDAEAFARALYCSNLLSEVSGDGVAEILGIGSGSDGRFTVVGKLVASSATIALANTGTKFNLDAASAREGSTIAHAWAALRVAQLTPRADENADELLALGRRFGVVSPATSLLVLESLDQWLRYDIEPPTTWESMHREWEIRREGRMQISSEEEMEQTHLINLIRAWIDLRSWWMQDHTAKHVAITPDGLHLCPRCGRAVAADARFCPYCGTPVGEVHDEYEANFGGPTIPDSALLEEPIGDAATVSYERLALSSAPRMMAQQEPVFASAASGAAIGTADFATDHVCGLADDFASEGEETTSDRPSSSASVQVKAWMPDAAYLKALTGAQEGGISATHDAYFQQRAEYSASPAFFIDCACWFLAHDDKRFGLRVLSNLAELRIEDAALLRVMAWRLREAGELHQALVVLRRVLKLRPEDSQSHRDCALVLDELARATYRDGDEAAAKELIEEAGAFYRTIALTPWQRRAVAISLFAVEEYNVMCAWASEQTWEQKPQLELIDEDLDGVLDCDLRITLAWDADETDVDLHVTEPSGEEAYFGNRRTHSGGRVSEDITDGYGPEQYEIRHAQDGVYNIRAHYYASHQQTIFGPASCTLTVYTDWGRPTQKQQITSTRLEAQKEMVTVGSAIYGTTAQ